MELIEQYLELHQPKYSITPSKRYVDVDVNGLNYAQINIHGTTRLMQYSTITQHVEQREHPIYTMGSPYARTYLEPSRQRNVNMDLLLTSNDEYLFLANQLGQQCDVKTHQFEFSGFISDLNYHMDSSDDLISARVHFLINELKIIDS